MKLTLFLSDHLNIYKHQFDVLEGLQEIQEEFDIC